MHKKSDGYLGGPAVDPLLPRDGWIHAAAEDVGRRAIEHWRQAPRPRGRAGTQPLSTALARKQPAGVRVAARRDAGEPPYGSLGHAPA